MDEPHLKCLHVFHEAPRTCTAPRSTDLGVDCFRGKCGAAPASAHGNMREILVRSDETPASFLEVRVIPHATFQFGTRLLRDVAFNIVPVRGS